MSLGIRRALKGGSAWLVAGTGADRLFGSLTGLRRLPLILGYHRVVEDFEAEARRSIPAMLVSARMLERHLDWVGRRYHFVPVGDLASRLQRGEENGRKLAAVTFDDGYRDVYHRAFPLLKRKGIPAAVFVVTGLVGTYHRLPHDSLYRLLTLAYSKWRRPAEELGARLARINLWIPCLRRGRSVPATPFGATRALIEGASHAGLLRTIAALEEEFGPAESDPEGGGPMTWAMLGDMMAAGITIGSHTRTHAVLSRETPSRAKQEIDGSRRDLERKLTTTVRHIAYPDGGFNDAVVHLAADAGYQVGLTLCRHRHSGHPLLTLPRKALWENSCLDSIGRFSPAVMSCQAAGVLDLASGCREAHG